MQLVQSDFDCLGQIAKHCNWSQLCIAIDRAKDFDVIPLLCYDLWHKIENDEEAYDLLINGGEFESCGGKMQRHLGIKRMWIYFAYAHYVIESAQKDTPTGRKVLDNDFSIPTPMSDLIAIEKKYRSMAFEIWEDIKSYLCKIGEHDDCEACGCNDCNGKVKKVSGVISKAIYR